MTTHRVDVTPDRSTANVSASPNNLEHLELRDGIFFYRKLCRHQGAMTVAVPLGQVHVLHRGVRRRIRARNDAAAFLCCVLLTSMIFNASLFPTVPAVLETAGVAVLVLVYFSFRTFRWPLRKGVCQTQIGVATDRRSFRITVNHRLGEDPAMEALLDALQRHDEAPSRKMPKGCMVELAESRADRAKYFGYAAGSLLLGIGLLLGEERSTLGIACLVAAGGIVLGLLLSSAMNRPLSNAMRAARSALLDGEFDTAGLILNRVLTDRPYHRYANYLMSALAMVNGDLDRAARHRAAMNGPGGRERLGVILTDLTRVLSSAPAFRELAEHARNTRAKKAYAIGKAVP